MQGVGFRPTVSRHAAASRITGTVSNCGPYVEIIAQGPGENIENFISLIRECPPKRASVIRIDISDRPDAPRFDNFEIIQSEKTTGAIFVSPDIAICDECKSELYDPKDRRYMHPFINCTCCGPRLTILESLPYDRERTSMKEFPMCPECEEEYTSPASRRFDAQPVCCPDCGPVVYELDPVSGKTGRTGKEAISRARQMIADGRIIAVKGIGGFHLCCDAANEEAVSELRRRKNRPAKPFAVMLKDEKTAERECIFDEYQQEILTGHQKPILLLEKKENGLLCPSIAPGNRKVGVMLPYAPVQLLLFEYDDDISVPDALVMTSGNISGAPICRSDEEALEQLGSLCDMILSNDRKIRTRADDSVMDFYIGKAYMIRRSRGYAPLPCPVSLPESPADARMPEEEVRAHVPESPADVQVLAIGGELKNTFCINRGELFYPSSYIGDLADPRSINVLKETVERYQTLLEVTPQAVACDLHPGYHYSEPAAAIAENSRVPLIKVQHHYAHIASCLAENDHHEKVIGVSFDGTGWGTDGTVWGGELMTADFSGFERVGSIKPFLMTGGDIASKEGWRIAVSMIGSLKKTAGHSNEDALKIAAEMSLCSMQEGRALLKMAELGMNTVTSTSAGRLFDAVSAILGICRISSFEGEAATALETAAWEYINRQTDGSITGEGSNAPQKNGVTAAESSGFIIMPTDKLVSDIILRKLNGEESDRLAFYFHKKLAELIVDGVCRISERTGLCTAALSGGCFQNILLTELVQDGLEKKALRVLTHSLMPPNDGGIALGQAAAAVYQMERK